MRFENMPPAELYDTLFGGCGVEEQWDLLEDEDGDREEGMVRYLRTIHKCSTEFGPPLTEEEVGELAPKLLNYMRGEVYPRIREYEIRGRDTHETLIWNFRDHRWGRDENNDGTCTSLWSREEADAELARARAATGDNLDVYLAGYKESDEDFARLVRLEEEDDDDTQL